MAATPESRGESNLPFDIARLFIIAAIVPSYRSITATQVRSGSSVTTAKKPLISEVSYYAGYLLVIALARAWHELVTRQAPEPYLDEVFHIPQAQKYCEGRYWDWDDKITTPPGLYAITLAFKSVWRFSECSPYILRGLNLLAIVMIAVAASSCRQLIEAQFVKSSSYKPRADLGLSFYAYHTALNVALFPIMFFFSGLYYTDLYSTLVVLYAYLVHLQRTSPDKSPSILQDVWAVVVGVFALAMRQTNVFWVVVYMGGLEAVQAIKTMEVSRVETPAFTSLSQMVRFYSWRYSLSDIHDPPLGLASPDDWVMTLLSIGIAALCNPFRIMRRVWPHITILGLFAAFVIWNGGVVLGDKSNHVATLHLAQMLYIWPLFTFFSAPLLLPVFINFAARFYVFYMSSTPSSQPPTPAVTKKDTKAGSKSGTSSSSGASASDQTFMVRILVEKYYLIPYYLGSAVLSAAVVRFNTIVHPFTLADNRHYMFYVFRYTILRSGLVRLALAPVYDACRALCFGALAGYGSIPDLSRVSPSEMSENTSFLNSPFVTRQVTGAARASSQEKDSLPEEDTATTTTQASSLTGLDDPESTSTATPPTSTAALWLLATALSLMTAPLVEPRYFILPWVLWRLLVPAWRAAVKPSSTQPPRTTRGEGSSWVVLVTAVGSRVDVRLVLETVWFLAINAATMYAFLFRPFYWRDASDGSLLDGGRVQRFMW